MLKHRKLQIVAVVNGQIEIRSDSEITKLSAGQFCLIPACLKQTGILSKSDVSLLLVEAN
jgi:mannose-6-phosphate isomerase class I